MLREVKCVINGISTHAVMYMTYILFFFAACGVTAKLDVFNTFYFSEHLYIFDLSKKVKEKNKSIEPYRSNLLL